MPIGDPPATTSPPAFKTRMQEIIDAVNGLTDDMAGVVLKSLFNANTILTADTDDTPTALSVAASRILGRKATGGIDDMTTAELAALFGTPTGTKFLADDGTLKTPAGGASGGTLLAVMSYERGTDGVLGTSSSTSFSDVDATNAAITFTVPSTGSVLVEASVLCRNDTAAGGIACNLREGGSDLAGTDQRMMIQASSTNQNEPRCYYAALVTGLTPAASKTYKLGLARVDATGTAQVRSGPALGPLVMKVTAAP